MKLSDEQLNELAETPTGTWQWKNISVMARELLAARKVVESARKACAAKPGYEVHEALDLVLNDITAYDEATK